jgi:two-component system response regulator YesN
MISELSQNWSVVGVASDGLELKELILSKRPDLAIVDIKMPYLSGLEAIQATQSQCPQMKWIVLTGYSEFTFAKEALKLGAFNYLLKPIDQTELASSLKDIEVVLQSRHDLINFKFGSWITDVCHGLGSELVTEEPAYPEVQEIQMFVFYMDSCLEEGVKFERLSVFYKKLRDMVYGSLQSQRNVRFAFVFLPGGELALIVGNHTAPNFKRLIDNVSLDLEQAVQEASGQNGWGVTLITADCGSYKDLKTQLDLLHSVSDMRVVCGIQRKWNLDELLKESNEDRGNLIKTIFKMVKYFEERSQALYMNELNECKAHLEKVDQLHNDKVKRVVSHYLKMTIGCQLDVKASATEWVKQLQDCGQQLLTAPIRKVQRPLDIVQQALLYIERNYMNEISILQIADELQVTPNYLSSIFHKRMGTTLIKYLTQLRLNKAQELLKESNAQVQAVAEMVGYVNPRYFAKLFTDMFGCTPSDFKKNPRLPS